MRVCVYTYTPTHIYKSIYQHCTHLHLPRPRVRHVDHLVLGARVVQPAVVAVGLQPLERRLDGLPGRGFTGGLGVVGYGGLYRSVGQLIAFHNGWDQGV